ncbi:MAG: MMPL family transporter [Vulcanisaeta sp. AZ3]
MKFRNIRSIMIIIIWLLMMIYLAHYAAKVFGVLTYDETQLMPSNIEPMVVSHIVNKYIGTPNKTTIVVVIKLDNESTSLINRLNYVGNVVRSIDAPNASLIDLLTVYNDIYSKYNETVMKIADKLMNNLTRNTWNLYWSLNNECSSILRLNKEYYSEVYNISSNIKRELNITIIYEQMLYNQIQNYYIKHYPNVTLNALFTMTTRNYVSRYGYSAYAYELSNITLRELTEKVGNKPTPYQLLSINITGLLLNNYERLIKEYPGLNSLNNITSYVYQSFINRGANETLLKLAVLIGPQANINLLKLLMINEYINNTPALLIPYLNQLTCNNNPSIVYSVVNNINSSIINIITQEKPPPSIFNLPNNITKDFLNKTYTVALITTPSNYEDMLYNLLVRKDWIYPVSTNIILYELEKIVTSDVDIIDKTTAILVFLTMISMLGTLIGPVASLTLLGLSYLASLGLLYGWAVNFKLYYLTVYMIAPIIFGIGIDYSMLMLSRYLEERIKGFNKDEALKITLSRVRPTILTSASVVGLGLGSFIISRYGYMQDIGIGFIVAVSLTIIATALVLPEVMRLLGDGLLWPMGLRAKSLELRTAFLSRMARFAVNRPRTVLAIFLVITALTLTYLLMNINITTDPVQVMPNTPAKIGLDILITHFRNYDHSTAYLVIYGNKSAALTLLREVRDQGYVINAALSYNNTDLYIITAIVNQQSLSDKLIPIYISLKGIANEISREYGARILIGGSPSYKYYFVLGFEHEYYGLILYVMIAVNIIILTIYMRSIMIPLRLVATVLMSITWSLALTIAVFQGLMGIKTYWLLPVILISLLLSVGTDYDLFIISRFKEEVMSGHGDREAIVRAVEFTGPVVTGAALVLAMAFASLAVSSIYILKQVALAVASSVIIDSFIIRPLLVPAIIVLLGKWNWWPFNNAK